ncbi:hypothetical protein NQ315_000709 [Exocentrus adspersus]|uniref:Uncharacterized protein n=1 Tax=Exocentrus adspersus TaxID=1586481 RepID=A0AAV8WER0_9CUCU|nr:hypothetical protein NQ315_000709 [Exocentrus adspersus]
MSDTKLGDDEEKQLPPVLVVSRFTAARGKEIQIMKGALSNSSGTKLAFQRLPRHMRRRAMSHNAKRLPRRLREIHLNQMKKSGLLAQQKRPSRKHKRKPSNIMKDYMRRQLRCKWLDTHLWHARRFHMVEKWGYKLPFSPCDKSFRACYRATVSHCLLQDISYYSCIEITGDCDKIVSGFKKISDPHLGLTIGAKAYLKGSREGNITIFKIVASRKAIGKIYFNWKPTPVHGKHVLWIWIHAAYYAEALDTIVSCFNLEINHMDVDSSNDTKSYTNFENIELRELSLCRFRLTGSLSNAVLQNCFHLSENNKIILEPTNDVDSDNYEQLKRRNKYWSEIKNISSTSELHPHMVLSLIIEDPRLHLPRKRTKSVQKVTASSHVDTLPENLAEGPIWDGSVRKIVKDTKPSNAVLTELRKKLLVPGSELEEKGMPVPVMLIQRPGSKHQTNIGYGTGWDIIIPSGWAQPVWISLIMWGARPGGLKQTNMIAFETNQPNFLYPDTSAGATEETAISNQYRERYFRLPPNKRTNYTKFKITSPFAWNWNFLLAEWNEHGNPVEDFFCFKRSEAIKTHTKIDVPKDLLSSKSTNVDGIDCVDNCLVPVSIKLSQKGLSNKFAIICLPQEGDLKKEPSEENCLDKNEKLRKELRRNHKTLLKRLRRRRIRAKRKGKTIPIDGTILSNYRSKMRELWLPQTTAIRHSCSREVIGFVRDGDFSFLLGQCKAIGYVAMNALSSLLQFKSRGKVLVRNGNSKQYRLGTLEIVM